jgi:acetyl esterase/lipase
VLLESNSASPGVPARWRLYRVDMQGRRTLLYEDQEQITSFSFDRNGQLAAVARAEDENIAIRRVVDEPKTVIQCSFLDRCTLLPVLSDIGDILLTGTLDGDLRALMRLDARGVVHTIHRDPRGEADLDDGVLDPVTRQPLTANYRSTVPASYGLTDEMRGHVSTLSQKLSGRDLQLQLGRGPDARWLIRERDSNLPIERWYSYDPAARSLRRILDRQPLSQRDGTLARALPETATARKLALSYEASDGARLHGFVSVPPGLDPARQPMMVYVHGGPWSQARPEFGGIVQFLVNRGYVVFEPNFRGSTGHGRAYLLAARGDFGNGRVQQDIVEGARYLLSRGIGDADRVGITGGSFGGYSTLLGLTFQPDLFKMGVAVTSPPDFGAILRHLAHSHESSEFASYIPFADVLRTVALDVDDAAAMDRLSAQSPLENAERLRRPLLLIASGEDRRVAISHVVEYASKLKHLGKDVALLVDDDATHTIDDPLTREAYLYLLELMLNEHLGAEAPTAPDTALRAYIDHNLRLPGTSLRRRTSM